jgi:hypothetical protein
MKEIKKSVINTFNRVGIDYEPLLKDKGTYTVSNRFTGETCSTSLLVATLIDYIYRISNQYEMGIYKVNISDFDRLRYFVLEIDNNAYTTCID